MTGGSVPAGDPASVSGARDHGAAASSTVVDEFARRAQQIYDAASDHYDAEPLGFWDTVGTRTVERLALARGARVLDVPCGSGASALAAARAVGSSGVVVGYDIAEQLLGLARAKARAARLDNLEFRHGDMRMLDVPDESFDAVVCVFGIFFVPDMVEQVARFWRLLRPNGVLAITTWGQDLLEPGDSAFWTAVTEVRPDLVRAFNPWDTLVTTEGLLRLYSDAGIQGAAAEPEEGAQPLRSAEDWWAIVLGSGYRGTVEALGPEARAIVREQCVTRLRDVTSVRVPTIYGTARKVGSERPG